MVGWRSARFPLPIQFSIATQFLALGDQPFVQSLADVMTAKLKNRFRVLR